MKKSMKPKYSVGTIRIKTKNLTPVIKTKSSWKNTNKFDTTNIKKIVHLYKSHANFNLLIDSKDKTFLKGFLTPDQKIRSERIKYLPSGQELNRAFSLFSPHLTIHDEKTNDHWDVIYQNPNGSFSHLYSKEKEKKSKEKKYTKVKEFKKTLPILVKRLEKAIKNNELMALSLYTLIKTQMRIGNEHSYKLFGHQGLTTLNKKNIYFNKNKINFKFVGKDGIPQNIEENFPKIYLTNLKTHIKKLKNNHFIFTTKPEKPLKDTHFENAFLKYSGKKFYPHIVRSYYATEKVEEFLKNNPKPTKEQIKELYNQIAERLGHKRFSKKDNSWKPNHTVTVSHYIDPKLVEKITKIILK